MVGREYSSNEWLTYLGGDKVYDTVFVLPSVN